MHSRRVAHEYYRDRLTQLARPSALLPLLDTWTRGTPGATEHGATVGHGSANAITSPMEAAGGWRRVYGRFHPFAAPYATMVFEYAGGAQTFATVALFDEEPADRRRVVHVDGLGWARLTAFPTDDRLRTLREALAVPGDVTVVRYRPGRRCTFRVDDGDGTRFGKVFGDASGQAIHEAGLALASAARRGEIAFEVARPIAWQADTRVLWQGAVAGAPLLGRLSTGEAESLSYRMGAALGTLTTATIFPIARFDAAVQCKRSHQYAQELGTRIPALAVEATSLGEGLDAIHRRRPGRVCPIHGAPHVNQWLAQDDRLALVDFDRFSAGNPELDVATFLGELDFEEELATPVTDIARAFVQGYEGTAGPLDSELLRAYRAHKRLAKALRSARALRPDGAERARRHLASARLALREGVAE